ncbi:MAG: SRPBCC domain-containing protein [Alphaproteobacteria bacterium]|nr:SRPBCC domain-containing protein [Alphaproteobacteria bacterium]MBU1512635.1 SRPBCC domain-containing protein [Alphaproteobacteria bacterium]MBU2095029.1 SRPBCC domain-containing protein [Alphaproteobacteria bacterium]MBU2151852.1 SRPBCC domain-containing protein [Alphaproteobacteria bacterium]MBU2306251.1 SRPBCC domain-containing protein [Alphaproteobacteria bacterium]
MTSKVYVALRVKSSPERAFAVFTQEIGAWWRPSGLFQTTPRAPGVLAFDPLAAGGRLTETLANGKVFEIGKVLAWEPPARLVFSWRQANFPPELHTEVEVRFEAVGEETRVSVEHRGFHQVPAESAARHGFPDQALLARLAEYWQAQIRAVGARVELR